MEEAAVFCCFFAFLVNFAVALSMALYYNLDVNGLFLNMEICRKSVTAPRERMTL